METILNHLPLSWFIAGIIFLLLEYMVPGFVIVFFGIGAMITAALSWAGILNALPVQIVVFIIASLLLLVLFRQKAKKYFKSDVKASSGEKLDDEIIGKSTNVVEAISSSANTGKVELHGTLWNAVSDTDIPKDAVVEITGRDNLTLKVIPKT